MVSPYLPAQKASGGKGTFGRMLQMIPPARKIPPFAVESTLRSEEMTVTGLAAADRA